MKFEVNCDVFNNDYLFSVLAGLLGVLFLYIDKCIFCKNNNDINYVSYFKIFITNTLIIYIILSLKSCLLNNNTTITEETFKEDKIDTNKAPF